MPALVYGVFDGVPYDNRQGATSKAPTDIDLEALGEFNSGNPISVFMSERGFLVFDPKVSLLSALTKHFQTVAKECCGKCTPCRTCSALLLRTLNEIRGDKDWAFWAEVAALGNHMMATSLCGIGQTGPRPLVDAITHFADELKYKPEDKEAGFYSSKTSPCIEACPGFVNIPRYIDYIKDGHADQAASTVLCHYPLVGSCGRVCVRSCEAACKRAQVDQAVSIRNLKRFAADQAIASGELKASPCAATQNKKVAIIGAGPAGVACAYHLLNMGYGCDIFEAKDKAGGMIRYGIPIYRLPKDTLQHEIDLVTSMGGQIKFNQKLGRDFHVDDLVKQGYAAVFIATGCPKGSYLGMNGEDTSLPEYLNGIDFLDQVYNGVEAKKPPVLNGDVVVVGGGNVAMDCCRAAARVATGIVHLVYRRTEADAPADQEEIDAAKAEGVQFHFLCGQDSLVVENGKIVGLNVQDMQQTEPDESGRRGVKPIPGSVKTIPCSFVIAAIGQRTDDEMLVPEDKIEVNRKNCIVVNSAQETSRPGVFAAGDGTAGPRSNGPSTMIMGLGQAYFAARSIDRYLKGSATASFDARWRLSEMLKSGKLLNVKKEPQPLKLAASRAKVQELEPQVRKSNFEEVELTMTQDEAWQEANRCLRCYRIYSVLTAKLVPAGN